MARISGRASTARRGRARLRLAEGGVRNAPAPDAKVVAVRHDLFGERLRLLEKMIDGALAESDDDTRSTLADAAELLLRTAGRLGRAVDESTVVAALRTVVSARPDAEVDPFGYDTEYEEAVAPLFRALYRTWWRVETRGIEKVPADGPVLLVGNHAGGLFAYDGAMLKLALYDEHPSRRRARPLVDDFVYHLPFIGGFMTRCGGVRACPENAEGLLQRGEAVIVFPEGTKGIGKPYRQRYRLTRFGRGGFVRIALRTGAQVVPVAIVGSEEIHPILGRWDWLARQVGLPYFPLTPTFPWLGLLGLVPLPSKWRIEFGAPLDWSSHGPEAARDRLLVSRLTEEVRQRVQRMVVDALSRRGPAFF